MEPSGVLNDTLTNYTCPHARAPRVSPQLPYPICCHFLRCTAILVVPNGTEIICSTGAQLPSPFHRYLHPMLLPFNIQLSLCFPPSVLCRGLLNPSASGKAALMQLVANRLLETLGHEHAIRALTSWPEKEVEREGDGKGYLERNTGVRGYQWLNHPAYLLLDEVQESYWDGGSGQPSSNPSNSPTREPRSLCFLYRMARRTGVTQALAKKLS